MSDQPSLYQALADLFTRMKFSPLVAEDLAERASAVATEWYTAKDPPPVPPREAVLLHALRSERMRWADIRDYAMKTGDQDLSERMDQASRDYALRNRVNSALDAFVTLPPFTDQETDELLTAVQQRRQQLEVLPSPRERVRLVLVMSIEVALIEGLMAHRRMVNEEPEEPT